MPSRRQFLKTTASILLRPEIGISAQDAPVAVAEIAQLSPQSHLLSLCEAVLKLQPKVGGNHEMPYYVFHVQFHKLTLHQSTYNFDDYKAAYKAFCMQSAEYYNAKLKLLTALKTDPKLFEVAKQVIGAYCLERSEFINLDNDFRSTDNVLRANPDPHITYEPKFQAMRDRISAQRLSSIDPEIIKMLFYCFNQHLGEYPGTLAKQTIANSNADSTSLLKSALENGEQVILKHCFNTAPVHSWLKLPADSSERVAALQDLIRFEINCMKESAPASVRGVVVQKMIDSYRHYYTKHLFTSSLTAQEKEAILETVNAEEHKFKVEHHPWGKIIEGYGLMHEKSAAEREARRRENNEKSRGLNS